MENMILMGSIVDDALEAIQTGLLWVCLCLDNAVYSLVNFVYQIILVLARVNVFEDTSVIDNFVNRVYIIIGVVALFLLAYSLLKALINPDEGLKGKNSPQKVIANVLISIALIAFTPTIFSVAMGFQNSLLEQGTLTGIIVGSSGAEESAQTISDGGFNLAAGVFQAFFHPNSDYCQYFINSIPGEENINLTGSGCTELEVLNGTYTYSAFWESMSAENSFSRLPELNKDILGKIDYTWLLSTAVGIFVVIVLVSYCIDIAIRAIKLAAYQLIAPIPILARLLPGDQGSKVFSNWVKACISTYLEVFIRLGILFFVVLIIAALQRNIGGLFSTFQTDAGFGIGFLAWAFLIVGLIFFIKDFPNIIKEITGLDSSKFNVLKSAKQGLSLIGGSVAGRSPLAGLRAWEEAGKNNNLKGIGNQYKRWLAKKNSNDLGATFKSRTGDRIRRAFGMPSLQERYDTMLERNRNPENKNKPFIASNDSAFEIKLPNGAKIEAGGQIELNTKNVQMLNEQKAINEQRKADIAEVVRQYKDIDDQNKKYKTYEDNMKSIAQKEIGKGKYLVRDENGNLLELSYTDLNGNVMKSTGLNTQTQLEAWLTRAKDNMTAEEYGQLSGVLKTAVTKHTVDSFIQNNGKDLSISGSKENVDLTLEKSKMAQELVNTNLYTVIVKDGKRTISDYHDKDLDDLVNSLKSGKQASDLTRKEIAMLSDLGSKTLHENIALAQQDEERAKSIYDEANAQIDRLFAQAKEQTEVIKASNTYKAAEAAHKANNIEDSGKK